MEVDISPNGELSVPMGGSEMALDRYKIAVEQLEFPILVLEEESNQRYAS